MRQKVLRRLLLAFLLCICLKANALEYESYACAFSSNFFELNKLSNKSFDPTENTKQFQRICIQLLKSNFQVSSPKDISKAVENLKNSGDNAIFQNALKLFEANKGKSALDIIKKQCLSVEDASTLFFAETMKDKLRVKDLSAWDNGRIIELYRCAVGAGYIKQEEALTAVKPAVDFLAATYISWDDYFAHYFAGKQLTALYDGRYSSVLEGAKQAYAATKGKINYGEVPLQNPKNISEKAGILLELAYEPSPSGNQWESVQKLVKSKKILDSRDLTAVQNIKKKFPDVPCIEFLEVEIQFRQKAYRKTLNLCSHLAELIDAAPKDSALFQQIQLTYAKAALKVSKPAIAEKALAKLPESAAKTGEFLETEGRLFAELCGTSSDYDKNEEYKKLANESFKAAEKTGHRLPQDIKDWMKVNGVRS